MSPDEEHITDNLIQHGGWIAAVLVATWGWIVKHSMGEVGVTLSRLEAKIDIMAHDLAHANEEIARIKGHLNLNGLPKSP